MAGNKNSGRKSGGKDFSGRVRSMFDRALEKLELKGDADKLMEKALTDDFVGTIHRMASYAPKQLDIAQTITLETTEATEKEWAMVAAIREQVVNEQTTH